jgi:predicted acylesterase/phospholipase RssA
VADQGGGPTSIGQLRRRQERAAGCAFVLSGGGNQAVAQVGMLRALIERGIVPDVVVGCSAGAFNGAVIAKDPTLAGVGHHLGELPGRPDLPRRAAGASMEPAPP